jgi:hypothetical protein
MYGFGRECRPLFWTTAVTTSLFGSGRASSSILHHRHTGPSSTASVQFRVQKSSAMSPCRRDAGSSFGSLCWTAAGRPHAYSDTSSRTTAPVLSVRKQRRPLITSPFPASSAERFGFACSAPLGSITWRRRARTPSSAGGCQTESVSTRLFVKGLTPSSPWSLWLERNARVFNAQASLPAHLVSCIQNEARQWKLAGFSSLEDFLH